MNKQRKDKLFSSSKRCCISNKCISGTSKEVVFVDYIPDYLKKMGYEMIKVKLAILMILFCLFPVSAQFAYDDNTLPTLNPTQNGTTIIINSTGMNISGLSSTIANSTYWKLDGTNVPTANWNMNNFSFLGLRNLNFSTVFGINPSISTDGGANLFLRALTHNIMSDLIDLGTGTNTAVSLTFNAGNDEGFILYSNGTFSSLGIDNFETNKPWFFDTYINISTTVNGTIFNGNGTGLKGICLSNGTGCSATSFNNTNVAYLNNSQIFTGLNNFTRNTIMSNLTVNNLTVLNFSSFYNNISLLPNRAIQLGGAGAYVSGDGTTAQLSGTIGWINAVILQTCTGGFTACAFNFLTSGGTNGVLTFTNSSGRSYWTLTRTGNQYVPVVFSTWYPNELTTYFNFTTSGGRNDTFNLNFNNTVINRDVNITRNLNVLGNITSKTISLSNTTNSGMDRCTLVAGVCTINNNRVTLNTNIFCTAQTLAGVALGQGLAVTARVAGVHYNITSGSALDTSIIACLLVEPS